MDSISGLPAHPLLVHLPVVAIPLAAIGAVLLALRPGWRRAYGPVVVGLAALGAVGGVLAALTAIVAAGHSGASRVWNDEDRANAPTVPAAPR